MFIMFMESIVSVPYLWSQPYWWPGERLWYLILQLFVPLCFNQNEDIIIYVCIQDFAE